jgi:uncharacterized protein (TIGR02646 family)
VLKIRNGRLPGSALDVLQEYQMDVDKQPDYPTRVARAKAQFSARNKSTNETFKVVRATLTKMCNGSRRCMYCEDSVADEVEHFQPKDLYPDLVFAWKNYLYACGPCNGPKNNKFAVLDTTSAIRNVTRAKKGPVVPPFAGPIALINPLCEDPLAFMILDLRQTFEFTPLDDPGTVDYVRTRYTLCVLRLNDRDYLIDARKNAFSGFRARLLEYVNRRSGGASTRELRHLKRGIQRAPHPTVWAEMKRQAPKHPPLLSLFAQAPEALEF